MAKHEVPSKRVARLAGRTLRHKGATKAAKALAGSVLAQTPEKKGRRKGKR